MRTSDRLIAACISLALGACSEAVSEVSQVEYARVAAVRVEAEADPTRASVSPDEAATARVLVIGPEGAAEVTYAMALCLAAPRDGRPPHCAGPIVESTAPSEASDAPTFAWSGLDLDATELRDDDDLMLLGTICEQGHPVIDANATDPRAIGACDDETLGVAFANRIDLLDEDQADVNHHPTLDAAELRIDDVAWDEGECGVTLPRDGKEHTLSIQLNDANREQVNDENEELLLAWFSTLGNLNLHYSVLEIEDSEDRVLEVTWTAPKVDQRLDDSSSFVTLVLRDQRGGVDWLSRTICVE